MRVPLKNILVPTDFSKGAEQALGRALLLPLAEGGRVHVVHVLPGGLPAKALSWASSEAKRTLDRFVARARRASSKTTRGINVTMELLAGEPFVEIIRGSRRLAAELIVLGRHGQRPIHDLLIGTTAERVIRKGDLPVLAVNVKPVGAYRRPLIATDLGDAARSPFDLLLRVLEPNVGDIGVLHAHRTSFEDVVKPVSAREKRKQVNAAGESAAAAGKALLASYQDSGVHWRLAIRRGDARSIVLNEALRRGTDVIALGTHGRSGVAHVLLGSVAEWVIRSAPCDVLVARPSRLSFELP